MTGFRFLAQILFEFNCVGRDKVTFKQLAGIIFAERPWEAKQAIPRAIKDLLRLRVIEKCEGGGDDDYDLLSEAFWGKDVE